MVNRLAISNMMFFFFFFVFFFAISWAAPVAYGGLVFVCLFVCFFFLGPHLQHMDVPRLGVKLELYLLAYTTATAMQDP